MTPGKRALDLALSLTLGILLLPVILLIALILFLVEGGPVLYASERMQTPTRAFRLLKFRTMGTDTSARGVTGGDKSARISRFQRFLRRGRLDELPQLWNVIRGDMSLVGPRPPLREYVEAFPEIYAQVLRSRPGVTGLASLHIHAYEERLLAACKSPEETDAVYRRRCVPRKARLDLIYQENRNLCWDLALIAQTVGKPFGRGA